MYHSCQRETRPPQVGKARDGPWQKTPRRETALGPGGGHGRPQPGNCPATSQGREGSEKRRSVLLLGPSGAGAKHPTVYGFSSDQRRGGALLGKGRGLTGRQWLRLGGQGAPSSGQRDRASEPGGKETQRMRPYSAPNTFSILSSAGGGRQTAPSSFGDRK